VPHRDLTRRRALTGAAVGGLSLPLLAACGGGGSSSTPTASGTTPPATDPSASSGGGNPPAPSTEVLVATSEVPIGGGVILRDQNVVVTQPTKGTFEGFGATCTHAGCQVSTVAAGTITCGCHGSQFSIEDGSNVTGPSGTPAGSIPGLGKVAVKVQGGNVVAG
jgi:nitrite reductase/ring-hydroxylating ferredoxin subunit